MSHPVGGSSIVRMGFVPGGGLFEGAGMIAFAGKIGLRRGFVPKSLCGSGTKPKLVDVPFGPSAANPVVRRGVVAPPPTAAGQVSVVSDPDPVPRAMLLARAACQSSPKGYQQSAAKGDQRQGLEVNESPPEK